MRTAHAAHRGGRTILLVVRVQNEENIESALERRIRPVFQLRGPEEHVEKIAAVAEFVVGIGERHAQTVPVRKRRQGRHFADQPVGLLAPRFGIGDVSRVGIKGRKRRDRRNQHAHRVSVVMKAVQKLLDALVDERVVRDVVSPFAQLRFGGQLAVEDQVGCLEVGASLRKLFDRIAAISEDSFVPIDESDPAGAGGRVRESRIITHHAKIGFVDFDFAQIEGADRLVGDRNFILRPVRLSVTVRVSRRTAAGVSLLFTAGPDFVGFIASPLHPGVEFPAFDTCITMYTKFSYLRNWFRMLCGSI